MGVQTARWEGGRRVAATMIFLAMASVGFVSVAVAVEPLRLAEETGDAPRPGTVRVELNAAAYRSLSDTGRGQVAAFPLPDGRRVDLDLGPFHVVTHDAVFIGVDSGGEHRRPRPAIRFLRGTAGGDPDSRVVLGLFQNRIAGFIRIGAEEFGIGPASLSLSAPDALEIHVWNRNVELGGWDCDGGHPAEAAPAGSLFDTFEDLEQNPGRAPTSVTGGPQLALEMAVDSTTEWCLHFDDDATAAETYLLNVVAQMSAFYDDQVTELVQVSFLRTHCGVPDPYTDGLTSLADRPDLLTEFKDEWSANMGAVSRATAFLFSHSDSSSAGGLAQTVVCGGQGCSSVLCNNDFAYGVNLLPATGGSPAGFEVKVVSHELGHNHSSPHTNCLKNAADEWLSTCAVETCGLNPWCQTTGCYPGPIDSSPAGTMMATGCSSTVDPLDIEDEVVEAILRGAAEDATCIAAAGLPGDVREQSGDGVRISKVATCPAESFQTDDGSLEQLWSACSGCQYGWIKRYTPGCYPFRLTRVDGVTPNVVAGRPIRILVYSDPAGTGDPANATLVHAEDTTVQVSSFSTFNEYTLATPITVASGDLYLGFYDLQVDSPAPGIGPLDTSFTGDSYSAVNTTDPTSFSAQVNGTWMIRGQGGPVPAGSLILQWGDPCNDTGVPGQDFAVYRGDVPNFTDYTSLTCSTNLDKTYFAESPADGSFFLVVPHTTPVEGSYGLTGAGLERPAAAVACKPQGVGTCP